MKLSEWKSWAASQLVKISDEYRQELAIIIEFYTGVNSAKQLYFDRQLEIEEQNRLNAALERRLRHEPLAYILGIAYFYDLELTVNNHTLIPRPETELLVDMALDLLSRDMPSKVLDLGTGSGAIAISIAKHRALAQVTATDIDLIAIDTAKANAVANHVNNIEFVHSDWFEQIAGQFDLIVSNPPYIAPDDAHLENLSYEPQKALVSADDGYKDIFYLIDNAYKYMKNKACLILEHGWQQGERIRNYAQSVGIYRQIKTYPDLAGRERMSLFSLS